MKKVTLYQVNKTEHVVTGDHLELRQYSYDQITPIRDSGGEFENLNNSLIVKCAEIGDLKAKNLQLEDRLVKANKVVDKVNQMGFWKRLVYLFKGKKVFK